MINRQDIPHPYLKGCVSRLTKENQTATASKYPQGYFKEKACKHCKTLFTPTAPSEHYCSDTCKDYGVGNAYLKRVYNITIEDYKDLYIKQNGRCAICNSEGYTMDSLKHIVKLNVDHCHETNRVRGLLCHDCNRGLGLFKDSIDNITNAINYLQESPTTIPNGSTSQANGDGSGEPLPTTEGEDIV